MTDKDEPLSPDFESGMLVGFADGLAYVGVSVYGRGVVMLPVNSLSIIGRTS